MSRYVYRTFSVWLIILLLYPRAPRRYSFYSSKMVLLVLLVAIFGAILPVNAQDNNTQSDGSPIRIGSTEFNEQRLLGKLLVVLLQEAGYPIEDQTGSGGSRSVRSAIENGDIDLYPEYTGTALSVYHGLPHDALPNSATRSYELAKSLDVPLGLVWLPPAAINNPFTLIVGQALVDQGIVSIADLADAINADGDAVTLCVESEFFGRPDGLAGLQALYSFTISEEDVLVVEASELYNNLRTGACEVAEGFATDGRIAAWSFTRLEDPLAFFPFYSPAPVIRQEIVDEYPELTDLINDLWQNLDDATITELSTRIEIGADSLQNSGDEEPIEEAVYNFLVSKRLVKPAAIKIGSKEFNEQLLLGKMMVLLLRDAGYEIEDMTGLGGSPAVRAALENGEIDLYPEYTGTATSLHHNLPVSALPADAQRTYLLAKSLDAPTGLIWLDAAPLNNTFTLMVGQTLIDQGVATLEDLAEYMNNNDSPLKICVEGEFFSRQDGLLGLQELYDFQFKEENILVMEPNDTYENLHNGACDVAEGYATDGRINIWDFTTLEDPLAFFPFYQPAPVIREETLATYPEIAALLNALMKDLDNTTMSALNARVDIGADDELASGDEELVEDVAYSYLREKRLVKLPEVIVSAADATESYQLLLGKILVRLLVDRGYQVIDKTDFGSGPLVREALEEGEVDLYMESVSTALANYAGLPVTALPTDRNRAYQLIKSLDAAKGIVWTSPTSYSPSYTLMAQPNLSDLDITGLDAFAQYMNENDAPFTICTDNNFYSRTLDGLEGLEKHYDFRFNPENIFLLDAEDIYEAFDQGECDVAAGLNTEALIRQYTVLEDPLIFFPATVVAPIIRQELLTLDPEIGELLATLSPLLTNEVMAELEGAVELGADGIDGSGDEQEMAEVVQEFLLTNDLIRAETTIEPVDASADPQVTPTITDTAPITETTPITESSSITGSSPITDSSTITEETGTTDITVASMGYTEQELLGKLLVLLLRDGGYSVVDQTGTGSSPDLRSLLENGEVDLYPEFPRTALTLFHNIPDNALPVDLEESYQLAKSLDETLNFVWLRKLSFDSAYALLVRQDIADAGITTIEELATYANSQPEPLQLCAETDFVERTESDLARLLDLYTFAIAPEDVLNLATDEIYRALRNGDCDAAAALQTDGRVLAWNFTVLQDPLGALPNYVPAPVIRRTVLDQYPDLEPYLDKLSPLLTNNTITTLNARVDLGDDGEVATGDEEAVEIVAKTFLCENGLIVQCNLTVVPTSVTGDEELVTPVTGETTTAIIPLPVPPVTIVNAITPTALTETSVAIEVTTPDTYGVNARATANISAPVVTVLPRNTAMRALARTADNNWLQIQLPDEQVVWVFTAAVLVDPVNILRLAIVTPPDPSATDQ